MELTGDPLIIGLGIAGTGITVVFLALMLVSLSLRLMRFLEPREAPKKQTAPVITQPQAAQNGQLSPELVAIIATAATETLGKPVRVTRITAYGRSPGSGWSRQGRLTIMASHQRRGGSGT
ncbi:MAG: OadG family protein [Oscillochloris sp.]|nr:OadG family protein [Oscillochloris sp.]